MQKLYKVALNRIMTKLGADKLETVNVQSLQALLKEKNIPLSEVDETIFHRLPREEVKNLVRNPCAINKSEQTSSEIVTNGKAIRGALNIVEKKICFKCPFVASCDKAFIEPIPNFSIQNPLANLLVSMKNISEVEADDKIKNRSWFSGVRVCDSLSVVIDDLMQGGQEFKTFKLQRNKLKDESESGKQKDDQIDEKEVLKTAKKNKVPLKDVYAQVPTSKKTQNQTENEGQEAFEQLSKGPENIFKKKKSDEFIKIAQKYLNEENVQIHEDRKSNKRQKYENRQTRRQQVEEQDEPRKPYKKQYRSQQNSTYRNRGQSNSSYRNNDRQQERRGQQRQRRPYRQNNYQKEGQYGERNQYRNKNFEQNKGRNENERYERRPNARNDFEQQNPRIRRLSKERPDKYSNNEGQRRSSQNYEGRPDRQSNRLDKFYTEIRNPRTDEQQILSNLNRKEYKNRESRLPRDAKYSNNDSNNQEGQRRDRKPREFNEREMEQFDRMEKIPKILKTEFAPRQDVEERIQQNRAAEAGDEAQAERKGRKVRR